MENLTRGEGRYYLEGKEDKEMQEWSEGGGPFSTRRGKWAEELGEGRG